MKRYLIKRLIESIPLLLGITLISFFLMHLAPGDPTAMLIDPKVKPEDLMRIKENLGLNKPIIIQYFIWLKNILGGNLGYSFITSKPVLGSILEFLPATILLMLSSLILTLIITIPLGVISAVNKGKIIDNIVTVFSFIGMSIPTFWLALVIMLLFSMKLGWFPSSGISDSYLYGNNIFLKVMDVIRHMFLPLLTMTITSLAGLTRYQRASMLEVIKQDYIIAARARGLSERVVIFKHALKNAILSTITILGLSLPGIFGGAFIIEYIFAWPGMGRFGVQAIFSRDYPVIMGIILFSSALIIIGNLLADIAYFWADPRIRKS